MELNWVDLLYALKDFIGILIKDLKFKIRPQTTAEIEDSKANPDKWVRVPEIYLQRLPDSKSAKKKAPYVLIQLITAADVQDERKQDDSYATIRIILCVYDDDEQEGSLGLLNLAGRIRIGLLKACTFGDNNAFVLDKTEKLEFMAYPDDTAPYYAGEMIGLVHLPPIKREVRLW